MWAIASLIGALAGHSIVDPLKWGVDFAMPAASYVLIPGKWYIILAVVTGTLAGVVLETMAEKRAQSC